MAQCLCEPLGIYFGILILLLFGAWQLNEVALMMAWLPVLAFVIYPYTSVTLGVVTLVGKPALVWLPQVLG